jgi:hypothetical protein
MESGIGDNGSNSELANPLYFGDLTGLPYASICPIRTAEKLLVDTLVI